MKTALVAGGAGFIGSHLCEKLLGEGYQVFALDSMVTGRRQNIEHLLHEKNFNWIEHDINSPLHLNGKCDEIYNLASPASPVDFAKMPDFILKTGSIGHRNLLNWAKDQKAKILFASTSEVYGDPKEHPQKESYFGNVNSYGPRSCYDEAKRFAEALTLAYRHQHKVNTRIVRIFNTYGPRMRPEDGRVIPNFFSQAKRGEALTIYGDGLQTRSLCYVSDMVDGIFKLMQSEIQDPVNMGNPEEYSILQLAEAVCKVAQKPFQVKHQAALPNDPQRRCPDISKARKELNWEPKIALAEGLAKTLNAL